MSKRIDAHRPSAIKPQDYQFVDGITGYHDYQYPSGRCAHCGHAIRYAVRFDYLPTGERLEFGEECAELIDTENRVAYVVTRMKKAAKEKAMRDRAAKQWFERRDEMEQTSPDVVEWLHDHSWDHEKFNFLLDMHDAFDRYGSLTEAQTNAVRRIMAKRIEQATAKIAEPEPTTLAPDGKTTVTGTIVSIKAKTGPFPGHNMLVKLSDGNKVWGTVPKSIVSNELVGAQIQFDANFKRSTDDEHFSYFSRPTKASAL